MSMTDREFVEAVFKDVVAKWGSYGIIRYRDNAYDVQLSRTNADFAYTAMLFECWLRGELRKRHCYIIDDSNGVLTGRSVVWKVESSDYRTALLSAARKLIEEGK